MRNDIPIDPELLARGRELAAYDARGEELPGEWIDKTDEILQRAEEIKARRGTNPGSTC